jgi:hypothetical protein
VTVAKFNRNIEPILDWHERHTRHRNNPYKLAAETFVSIVGQPQPFVEGNHRTGALIASLYAGLPPFVLSVDNALTYFAPSAEIKQFADRSTWRGRRRIPKYRKSFRVFLGAPRRAQVFARCLRLSEADSEIVRFCFATLRKG